MDTDASPRSLSRSLSEPSLLIHQQRNVSASRRKRQSLSLETTKRSMSLPDLTLLHPISFQHNNSNFFTHTESKEDGVSTTKPFLKSKMATPNQNSRLPLQAIPELLLENSVNPLLKPAKALLASRIPIKSESSQTSQQKRVGWKTPWKTQGKVTSQPKHPKHQSPGPESSSGSRYEGLPLSSKLIGKLYDNELPAPASSISPPAQQPEPLQQVMEAFSWPESGIPLADIMRYQNCNVDRSPAEVGEPCTSKLVITLYNPRGKMINPANPHHDAKIEEPFRYPVKMSTVDWLDKARVRKFNRWRNAIFEHYFGPYAKAEEIEPHALEAAFVVGKYEALERAVDGKRLEVGRGGRELPSLARIVRDYNATFEGQSLDGDRQPRPGMTREMLRRRYLGPKAGSVVAAGRGLPNGEAVTGASTIGKATMDKSYPAIPSGGTHRPSTRYPKALTAFKRTEASKTEVVSTCAKAGTPHLEYPEAVEAEFAEVIVAC